MNLWYRYAAVLGGIAVIVYIIETYGHTNLAELEAGDILFYGFAFLITQAAIIWGMLFDSPGEPSRLANAAPALLGSVLGGCLYHLGNRFRSVFYYPAIHSCCGNSQCFFATNLECHSLPCQGLTVY